MSIRCLQSFRTNFDFLKLVDDLRPLNHQAGIQGTLKQCEDKLLVDRMLMQHISFLCNGISFDAQSIDVLFHVTVTQVNNPFQISALPTIYL